MKTVAVIGAGASGITALKCCLDEGLEPICFERTGDIGGLWNYTPEVREGQASVMKSTIINTSKEMMCYSDFPLPKEFPLFMHHSYVKQYFELYIDRFNLRQYIKFETEILLIKPADDYDVSYQWNVSIKNKRSGKTEKMIYDAVMVCTGHHAEKKMAEFPGMDKFKGAVVHSHDYRTPKGFEDKRVVTVGIGNSGCDAAVELGSVASKVFLSTRRGSWIFSRISDSGIPIDMAFATRFGQFIKRILPEQYFTSATEKKINQRFDHKAYSLQPEHSIFQCHPTVSDDLPIRIISGTVVVKSNIKEFTSSGVVFDDGTFEDNIDLVLLATGYIFGFPFIDKSIIDVKDNQVDLYKYVFPPDLEKPTLAVIGCFQPIGAVMPMSETQCRLATRVFKGDIKLPSKEERWLDIRQKRDAMSKRFVKSTRHTIQVDFISYMNELSSMIGCMPDIGSILVRDPKLALECFFGPCTPYQYRLTGPGKWSGAREAILTQWDRAYYPLKTRPLNLNEKPSRILGNIAVVVVVAIIAYLIKVLIFPS